MSANKTLLTIAVAAAVLLMGAAPAAAQTASGIASQTVTATVETTDDATVVTIEEDTAVATDATVSVDTVGDASYSGSGSYELNEDRQVVLPHPDEEVTVELTVETSEESVTGFLVLDPDPDVEFTTTVVLSASIGVTADS